MTPRCRHCGDDLPRDAPPGLASCKQYADWRARQAGDRLGEGVVDDLALLAHYCALAVALSNGMDELTEVP
jgi:hypothetical protein